MAPQDDEQALQSLDRLARAVHRRVGIDRARAEAAHEPQRRLLALEIAAEPEQIVGGSARQIAEHAHDPHLFRRRQQGRRFDRPVGEHPDVGRFDALAHRHRARVRLVGDAAEAARHHAPALRRRGGVDAQHERAGDKAPFLPARRRRKPHDVLADIIDAARLDRGAQRRALVGSEFAGHDAAASAEAGHGIAKGAGDRNGIERGENARPLARLAAPPCRDVRHR